MLHRFIFRMHVRQNQKALKITIFCDIVLSHILIVSNHSDRNKAKTTDNLGMFDYNFLYACLPSGFFIGV